MPTYQYACTACEHRFDAVQSFSDPSLTVCPQCAGKLRKVFSSVGIVFKGSGFYRTDSRAGAVAPSESSSSSESTKTADSSSSTSSSSTGVGHRGIEHLGVEHIECLLHVRFVQLIIVEHPGSRRFMIASCPQLASTSTGAAGADPDRRSAP